MFARKVKVTVSLSDEARAAFTTLESNVLALTELVTDLVGLHKTLVAQVQEDVAITVDGAEGVQVFAEAEPKRKRSTPDLKPKTTLPPQLAVADAMLPSVGGHPKQTPFSRAPRGVQVEWLIDVLRIDGSGGWLAPATISKAYAADERHNRYLRGIISRRLGEMFDDNHPGLERRASEVRGSMFEYRLRQP